MRLSIDPQGIAHSTINKKLESALASATVGITEKIFEQYNDAADRDGTGFFKDFLSWLISDPENYFKIPKDLIDKYFSSSKLEEYAIAAYFNGNKHITGNSSEISKTESCQTLNLEIIDASTFEYKKKKNQGTNIVDIIDINSKTRHPPSTITKYFSSEIRVVIYDRYLKPSSLELIESIAKKINKKSELVIISEFNSGVSHADCSSKIKPIIRNTKTYYPNFSESSEWHDRHIHLGDRLHMTFSSGIDCFGIRPKHENRECQITIYHIAEQNELKTYHVMSTTNKSKTKVHTLSKKIYI